MSRLRFRSASLRCYNVKRLRSILQPGDTVRAFIRHRKIGFHAELEVRAIAHWGVYAVLRDPKQVNNISRHMGPKFRDTLVKRQFLIKWCHISRYHLRNEPKEEHNESV
jgi:hypothetical protein